MTDKIVVLSMCSSGEEARRIAGELIAKRLAACVNLMPNIRSIYHWKGRVEESDEVMMIIKSTKVLFEELRDEIARLHSYEVPEIIALPVAGGAASYFDWMDRELTRPVAE